MSPPKVTLPYRVLISRLYLSDSMIPIIEEERAEVLIDCGAFTYDRRGEYPELSDYVGWLKELPFRPVGYFQLDVIGDAEATLNNYREMLDMGLRPIPIWTRGAPVEHFYEMADSAYYVAVGGIAKSATAGARDSLSYLRWLHEEIMRPEDRVHWLGVNAFRMVNYYLPAQYDSLTWQMPQMFGRWISYLGNGRWKKEIDDPKTWKYKFDAEDYRAIRAVGCDPGIIIACEERWERDVAGAGQFLRYAADLERLGTKAFFVVAGVSRLKEIAEARRRGIEMGLYAA